MWVVATVFLVCIGIKGVQKMGHKNAVQSRRMFYAFSLMTVIYFALSCIVAHDADCDQRTPDRYYYHAQSNYYWSWNVDECFTNEGIRVEIICSFLSTIAFGGIAYHFRKESQGAGRPAYYNDMAYQPANLDDHDGDCSDDIPMIVDPLGAVAFP